MLDRILAAGLISVIRVPDPKPLPQALEVLLASGVTVAEITLTVPNALEVIRQAKAKHQDRMIVGVGTVLTASEAIAAIDAGAEFVVSPILDFNIIRVCKERLTVVMPGCFSPTEIWQAWNAGADVVKIFPGECVGPAFFKALRGPLPQVKLMPSGGVDASTARGFLEAGAVCLGVGGQLIDARLLANQDWPELERRARTFRRIVDDFRDTA